MGALNFQSKIFTLKLTGGGCVYVPGCVAPVMNWQPKKFILRHSEHLYIFSTKASEECYTMQHHERPDITCLKKCNVSSFFQKVIMVSSVNMSPFKQFSGALSEKNSIIKSVISSQSVSRDVFWFDWHVGGQVGVICKLAMRSLFTLTLNYLASICSSGS